MLHACGLRAQKMRFSVVSTTRLVEKQLDMNNDDHGIGDRLKTIASENHKLKNLLKDKSTIALVQQPDTYGWFTVEDAAKWQQ